MYTYSPLYRYVYTWTRWLLIRKEGSPAGNLDPDDPQYIEKLRVRQKLLAEMRSQGVEPRAVRAMMNPISSALVRVAL